MTKEVIKMTKQELIEYYEGHLKKVKIFHSGGTTDLQKDKENMYIQQAEKDLEEVKNGRMW